MFACHLPLTREAKGGGAGLPRSFHSLAMTIKMRRGIHAMGTVRVAGTGTESLHHFGAVRLVVPLPLTREARGGDGIRHGIRAAGTETGLPRG